MNEYNFFTDENTSEEDRASIAFHTVAAMRDVINLAEKNSFIPTYEKSLAYIKDISPNIYDDIINLLPGKNESEIVKLYKEKADGLLDIEAKSQLNERAIQLILEEIDECDVTIGNTQKNKQTKSYKKQLKAALIFFETRELVENQLLNHDFFVADRGDFSLIDQGCDRKDYKLSNDKTLRIYLAHMTNIETKLGVDMIYECYDLKYNLVRIAHLQYKTWKTKSLVFDDRELKQIDRLKQNNCSCNNCIAPKDGAFASTSNFRYPYCSAFLRPTNKIMPKQGKMKTMGDHIPLCKLNELITNQKSIDKSSIHEISITQNNFEEGFNKYQVGSRWMPIGDLQEYYKRRNLNDLSGNVRIIAQEVEFKDEMG